MTTVWMFLLVCLGFQYALGDVLDNVRTHIPDSYRLKNPVKVATKNGGDIVTLLLWNITVNGLSTIDLVKNPVVTGDSDAKKFDATVSFKDLNFEGTFAPTTLGSDFWNAARVSIDWESNRFSIQGEVTKSADKCQAAITNVNVDELSDPQISFINSVPLYVKISDLNLIKFVYTPNIKKPLNEVLLKELDSEVIKQIISDILCQGLVN